MRDDSADKLPYRDPFGVILVNLGTPNKPTAKSIRQYLKLFLSDPRVIDLPPVIWWFILNGIILPLRSRRIAHSYQAIWDEAGSPLRVITNKQAASLQRCFNEQFDMSIQVFAAMNYGEPSLQDTLTLIQKQGLKKVFILPLFPQYSSTTTASTFDAIAAYYKKQITIPEIHFLNGYHTHEAYINALAQSIKTHWESQGRAQHLVFSFHGIPLRYYEKGDKYPDHCRETAMLVAKALHLNTTQWTLCFQSRFGPAQWVQPYTLETLQQLPLQQIKSVEVISPGFSADCLETLEELAVLNRNVFLKAGGQDYHYIPALNATDGHINMMLTLVLQNCRGWME